MSVFKPVLRAGAALALGLAAALPATAQQGDPRPGFAEVFDPNLIAGFVANAAITALRTQMEVSYEHMSTDIMRGQVALSGVRLRPFLPYDRAGQCVITIDRATLSGDPMGVALDVTSLSLSGIGVEVALACLPSEPGLALRQVGLSSISVDRVGVEAEYITRSGDLELDVTLGVNGIGVVDLSAAGTLLPRPGPFGAMDGDPAVRLSRAVVSLADRGGWEAVSPLIPEGLRDPEAIRQIAIQALSDLFSDGGASALGAAEVGFIEDLASEAARFAADPGEITIEAQLPSAGLVVEPRAFDKPARLVALLSLDARTAPSAREALVDPALLEAGELDDAERMALATALIDGIGVPRAPARAVDLLAPLVDAGDGTAIIMSARALADRDVTAAYGLALLAPEADGVVSLLDGLEARMTTGDVLDAQSAGDLDTSGAAAALPDGGDPRDLRRAAVAFFTGSGAARNYANAYLFALLAEAAGDIGADQFLSEIEGRFEARGDAVTDLWRERAAEIENAALALWIAEDLATRYASP